MATSKQAACWRCQEKPSRGWASKGPRQRPEIRFCHTGHPRRKCREGTTAKWSSSMSTKKVMLEWGMTGKGQPHYKIVLPRVAPRLPKAPGRR